MLVTVTILVQLLHCKLSETSELWAKTDGRVKFYASGRTAAERSPGVLGISTKTRKTYVALYFRTNQKRTRFIIFNDDWEDNFATGMCYNIWNF